MPFKIRIDTHFDFSCAFILTYGNQAERLHGHNFQVALEIEGSLDESQLLVDFRHIKSILREICKQLDEHTRSPTRNSKFSIEDAGDVYSLKYQGKHYLFPKDDVILLDLPNLSTEILAAYLCDKIKHSLITMGYENLTAISVEISEKIGQSATYTERFK